MKKTACAILVVVFMMTIIVSALARPVAKCPVCNGEYYETRVIEDWKTTSVGTCSYHVDNVNWTDHWDGHYTQQRKVAIVCSNGTHITTETRQRVQHDVNPGGWGWYAILH